MARLTLHPPLEIGPRLLPAVSVSPGTDHAGRVSLDPGSWEYYIDLPDGTTVHGDDFQPARVRMEPDDMVRAAMGSLLSFLGAFAESVDFERRTGIEGECSDLFPAELREWAYLNSDEIGLLSYDLEHDDTEE